jgi:hypothetical protein
MEQKVDKAATMSAINPAEVLGWGVDADPRNNPTYPMRDRTRDDSPGMNWSRPSVQRPHVEILRSIEHNRQPAAVGTSTPPKGVSGSLRRYAFRYSESQWAHWLLLMLADRINVVEGLAEDLGGGRPPNFVKEWGLSRGLKANPRQLATAAVAGVGVVVLAVVVARVLDARDDRRRWW